MKTHLSLGLSSIALAGMLPNLTGKIVLSAAVLVAALAQAACYAPSGYQDQEGFHAATRKAEGAGVAA